MKSHLDILDFFIINGTFVGFLLGVVLLFIKGQKNWANRFLGLLVIAFALYTLPAFIDSFGLLGAFPHLIRIHVLSGYLVGPLIYFYVKASTTQQFQYRPIYLLHLVPFLLDAVYHFPFFFQSGAAKLQFYSDVRSGDIDVAFHLPILLKAFHASIYFGISVYAVFQYKKHLENEASTIDKDFHRWLLFFSSVLLVPLLSTLLFLFSGFEISSHYLIVFGFFLFLVAVLIAALIKPRIFHVFPHPMPQESSVVQKEEIKYKTSNLQEPQKEKLAKKLLSLFAEEKPYLEAELTLSELAGRLSISPNHLSQIINEKIGQKFLDFVNQYRVEEAKRLLADEKMSHLTILSIAYDAGFNSKTAFYSAFKKQTGSSPSKYRKSLANGR
ncbi:MAG: helix-turn-helix domain-containing protein [Bacteroidota bacterium]